jgi:hypothetical protein
MMEQVENSGQAFCICASSTVECMYCFEGWHAVADTEETGLTRKTKLTHKMVTSEPICEVMRKSKFLLYVHALPGDKVCYVVSAATTTTASYWTSSRDIVINPRDSDEEK